MKWKVNLTLLIVTVLLGTVALASGTDLLTGATDDITATVGGTGRKIAYLTEGISALLAYQATKKWIVLGSIGVVACFINVWMGWIA